MMQEKFGVEIETISKRTGQDLSGMVGEKIGLDRVDTVNHYYHGHDGKKWGFESDGSLRPNGKYPHGVEIISPPLKIHQLGEVKTVLAAVKGKVAANSSCGLHVHIECESAETVKNVLMVWRKLEDRILAMFPVSRHNNRYCKRLKGMNTEKLLSFDFSRYHMINPNCWALQGTVEFRGHAGTVDYYKIKRWVFLCAAIVRTAKSYVGRQEELGTWINRRGQHIDIFDFLGLKGCKTENYVNGRIRHFEKLAA